MKRSFDEVDDIDMNDVSQPIKKQEFGQSKKLFDECIDILLPNFNFSIITDQIRYQMLNHVKNYNNYYINSIIINCSDNYKKIVFANVDIIHDYLLKYFNEEGFININFIQLNNDNNNNKFIIKIFYKKITLAFCDYYS